MSYYVKFPNNVLVEVSLLETPLELQSESSVVPGTELGVGLSLAQKDIEMTAVLDLKGLSGASIFSGFKRVGGNFVKQVNERMEDALSGMFRPCAEACLKAMEEIPVKPSSMEGEATYQIKLTWERPGEH